MYSGEKGHEPQFSNMYRSDINKKLVISSITSQKINFLFWDSLRASLQASHHCRITIFFQASDSTEPSEIQYFISDFKFN
jgi:hypothetical protein